MDARLFTFLFLGIIGGISLLLYTFKFHRGFVITFFLHGSIFMAVSVWESPIWFPGDSVDSTGGPLWHYGFWWLFMGLILIAFLLMFIYAQSREKDYKPFGKKYSKEASVYLVFLIGNWLTFGALEDFGCYIIWGLDKFYEYAQYIHQDRFFLGIPTVPTKLDKLGHEVQNEGLNDVAGTGACPERV
jgi:hypothetical protein